MNRSIESQKQYEGRLESFEPQHGDDNTSLSHSSTTIIHALKDTSENF